MMQIRLHVFKRRIVIDDFGIVFAVSFLLAVGVLAYAQHAYSGTPYFYTFAFFALALFLLPVGGYVYYKYVTISAKEYYFPQFLKDLADGVRAGLPLPQAVVNVSKVNYGPLTEDVKKLATYVSWGIPFEEALTRFAQRTGSKMIRSSIQLILEAYRAGGGIADILDTMAEDAGHIHTLREERKTKFSGFVSTLYAVYIIFLLITVILVNVLLPELPTLPSFSAGGSLFGGGNTSSAAPIPEDALNAIFFNLAILEAVFSGVLAGVAGEGSISAGIKHAIILTFIGVAIFQLFIPVPNPVDRISRALVKLPVNVNASVNIGRFFTDENITVGMVRSSVAAYMKSTGIAVSTQTIVHHIQFVQDPRCNACNKGYVEVLPDAVLVYKPTYLDYTIKTDPQEMTYEIVVK
ncbi:MAG: type II secretion system F family protein [Candidatus Diapherotrites archaeon]|nr:type II secretion system F family protein [Candidatus Diapherotrites archaeon]